MMSDSKDKNMNDVLCSNPLAYEQKLLVNKKCKTLDEIRQSFKQETSSVLSQVRSFLPKLASANDDLQRRLENEPACLFDIENVETDQAHIEMDLALFEEDSSCEDSSSEEESEEESMASAEVNENNLKLTKDPSKTRPVIQVLSETNSSESDLKA